MTVPLRAVSYLPPGEAGTAYDLVILFHDERRVRRKLLKLVHGDEVLVDFPTPTTLESGGALVLEDGRLVEVVAGEEKLYEVRGRDGVHLMQLAWHLGNRHLPVQIESERDGLGPRLLIQRDPIIRTMLIGLGAAVTEIAGPFSPLQGAYHDHGHALLNR